MTHEQAGDLQRAFEAFRQSAKAAPRLAAPLVGLARLLTRNQQPGEAIACLERAAHCEPENAAVAVELGQALVSAGRLQKAEASFRSALRVDPLSPDALLGLGAVFEDRGDREAAAAAYRELLRSQDSHAQALAGLISVADGDELHSVLREGQDAMLSDSDIDTAVVGYALGKGYARSGRHDAAFAAWSAANEARRREAGAFDRERFDRRVEATVELFSEEFFARRGAWGDASELPVLVVGLPRSGTTLTERIVGAHSMAFGAGELPDLADLASGTPGRLGRADPPWPEAALELQQEHTRAIGAEYAGRLAARVSDERRDGVSRVLDKQPLNFWHLGLVALALPHARVLHCSRDLRDNGLSIFAENFTPRQRWATDLADIAYYWRGYRRIMEHWKRVSGLRILEVPYERTVADLEGQARQILSFLELPFESAVLSFHEDTSPVQTPSRWQVRAPLYKSSAGRWRYHAAELAPLIEAVEKVA
ncbi:MAG: sulfotransferase [Pseudomonadota bacterium]